MNYNQYYRGLPPMQYNIETFSNPLSPFIPNFYPTNFNPTNFNPISVNGINSRIPPNFNTDNLNGIHSRIPPNFNTNVPQFQQPINNLQNNVNQFSESQIKTIKSIVNQSVTGITESIKTEVQNQIKLIHAELETKILEKLNNQIERMSSHTTEHIKTNVIKAFDLIQTSSNKKIEELESRINKAIINNNENVEFLLNDIIISDDESDNETVSDVESENESEDENDRSNKRIKVFHDTINFTKVTSYFSEVPYTKLTTDNKYYTINVDEKYLIIPYAKTVIPFLKSLNSKFPESTHRRFQSELIEGEDFIHIWTNDEKRKKYVISYTGKGLIKLATLCNKNNKNNNNSIIPMEKVIKFVKDYSLTNYF